MSAKTKIIVLRMKELIYTGILVSLGILIIILLIVLLRQKNPPEQSSKPEAPNGAQSANASLLDTPSTALYVPGIYTTQLTLNGQSAEVAVIVEKDRISSVSLTNLEEAVAVSYPLLAPTLQDISNQLYETQSLEEITYGVENKYTALVLLQAIGNSLDKALIENRSYLSDY